MDEPAEHEHSGGRLQDLARIVIVLWSIAIYGVALVSEALVFNELDSTSGLGCLLYGWMFAPFPWLANCCLFGAWIAVFVSSRIALPLTMGALVLACTLLLYRLDLEVYAFGSYMWYGSIVLAIVAAALCGRPWLQKAGSLAPE